VPLVSRVVTVNSSSSTPHATHYTMSKVREDEMRAAFKVFDIDGNGTIDEKELRATMKKLGENLSDDDVKAMIKAADKNNDGKVDYEEFIKMMLAK